MSNAELPPATTPRAPGSVSALAAYGCYLLSIPSAGVFAVIGLIIAYAGRDGAADWVRSHLDKAISTFWTAAFWNIALAVVFTIGIVLSIVLIGIPLVWLAGAGWFVVMVWFTIMSALGLVKLLDQRPA